jgi:hypothetical protein
MWGEELSHGIVVKREARGAQSLRVSSQVQFAAQDARLKLRYAIAAIAEPLQDELQVSQQEDIYGGVCGQLLL